MRETWSQGVEHRHLAALLRAVWLLAIEGISRGSVPLCLLVFVRFYSPGEFAVFLPWLACQQLITVLSPFGILDILPRLLGENRDRRVHFRRCVQAAIGVNLLFVIPGALGLTFLSVRGHLTLPSPAGLLLIAISGAWLAVQRTRQQVEILTGSIARVALARSVQGAVHVVAAILLAYASVSAITAFCAAQLCGLLLAEFIRDPDPLSPPERPAPPFRDVYPCLLRKGATFGVWSVFGWFSGYGATILLARVAGAAQIALYGQAIACIGLMQLMLGSVVTSIQSSLLRDHVKWSGRIQHKLDAVFDWSCVAVALASCLVMVSKLQNLIPSHPGASAWPDSIWLYYSLAYASLTLYQRSLIRLQYDSASPLGWRTVMLSETVGLSAFAVALAVNPEHPLWAHCGLLAGRCISVYFASEPLCLASLRFRVRTLSAVGLANVAPSIVLHMLARA